jgi:hypothetical protein
MVNHAEKDVDDYGTYLQGKALEGEDVDRVSMVGS